MNNHEDKRISLEMSIHALAIEISRLAELADDMMEVDRIYLRDLSARLNLLHAATSQQSKPRIDVNASMGGAW